MALTPPPPPKSWRPRTILTRGGLLRSQFQETGEAIFMTSGFVYGTAEEAEAAFAGEGLRFVYSRYANPTVSMFEERLRLIEGAEACRATASGMAAVFASLACFVNAGDRVVASRALFGSCLYIIEKILPRYGVIDRAGRRARSQCLEEGAQARRQGGVRRKPVQSRARDHRSEGGGRSHPPGGGLADRRQRLRDAAAAEAAEARRRHRGLFGDQAYRRPGPQPGRRGARHPEIRGRPSGPVPAPHRPGAVALQRLAAAEGARDHGIARPGPNAPTRCPRPSSWKSTARRAACFTRASKAIRSTLWPGGR